MNIKLRNVLFAAGGCILVGCILAFIAVAAGGFRMENLNNEGPWEERTFSCPADQVAGVYVRTRDFDMVVEPWDGGEVEIRYYVNENVEYEESFEGGVMRLTRTPLELTRRWFVMGFRSERLTLRVRVPAEHRLAGDFGSTNDGIAVSGLAFDTLGVRTSNGRIDVRDVTVAGELKLRSTNDSLTLTNVSARGRVEAITTNGRVSAANLRCKDLELRSTNDSLRLTDALCRESAQLHSTNGRLHLERVNAPRITASTTNDSIDFSGLEFQNATFTSTNGRITGSLPGPEEDYAITASTTNGRVNAGGLRSSGGKALSLRTTNDSIRVGFQGEKTFVLEEDFFFGLPDPPDPPDPYDPFG